MSQRRHDGHPAVCSARPEIALCFFGLIRNVGNTISSLRCVSRASRQQEVSSYSRAMLGTQTCVSQLSAARCLLSSESCLSSAGATSYHRCARMGTWMYLCTRC